MEIKTQHKPGDFVWYFSKWTSKLHRAEIIAIYQYQNEELTWKLDATERRADAYISNLLSPVLQKDSECFKTKKELVEFITDPAAVEDFHLTVEELQDANASKAVKGQYTSKCVYVSPAKGLNSPFLVDALYKDIIELHNERTWGWDLCIDNDVIRTIITPGTGEWTLAEVHRLEDIHAEFNNPETIKEEGLGLQEYTQKVLNRFYGLDCKSEEV